MKELLLNHLLNRRAIPIKQGGEVVKQLYLPKADVVFTATDLKKQKPEKRVIMYAWA